MNQDEYTKVNLNKTYEKDTDMKSTIIKTSTLVISRKEKLTEKAFTHGQTESITKENGTWVKNMVLESGKEMEVNLILAIGNLEKQMAKVLTPGKMETSMKETGWTA